MSDTKPIDDGGNAFPCVRETLNMIDDKPFTARADEPGMGLRDWFAGQALQGFMAQATDEGGTYTPSYADEDFVEDKEFNPTGTRGAFVRSPEGFWHHTSARGVADRKPHRMITSYEYQVARDAYKHADAMIAARKGEPK